MKKRIWDVKIVPPYANYVVLLCLILFFLPQRVSVLQIRIPGPLKLKDHRRRASTCHEGKIRRLGERFLGMILAILIRHSILCLIFKCLHSHATAWLDIYMHTHLDSNMFIGFMFICLHAWIFGCLFTCLDVYILIFLDVYVFICLYVYMLVCSCICILTCSYVLLHSYDLYSAFGYMLIHMTYKWTLGFRHKCVFTWA